MGFFKIFFKDLQKDMDFKKDIQRTCIFNEYLKGHPEECEIFEDFFCKDLQKDQDFKKDIERTQCF